MKGLAGEALKPTSEFWNGKRVFLTGHTGFKGAWLTLWLASMGASVRGYALAAEELSLFRAIQAEELCESVVGDVLDGKRLHESMREFCPDVAIHMAAQSLVRRSYLDPVLTWQTNVQGTINFLESCRTVGGIASAIVVTTDKVYENLDTLRPYREDDALGGHDPYSASKAGCELAARSYSRSYRLNNLATVRSGNVFGGGDWNEDRLIPDAIRAFSARQTLTLRSPNSIRPWQHVVYPLTGYLMLARAMLETGSRPADTLNFGPADTGIVSVKTIIETMAIAWGDDAVWQVAPEAPEFHEAARLVLNSERAANILGWSPSDDISRSLQMTVDWYKFFYAGATATQLRELTQSHVRALLVNCFGLRGTRSS